MKLNMDSPISLYIQIAEGIEDDILNGILIENERAYSQYQVAELFEINPATAGKGIKSLEEEGILFKRRGMGMYVAEGAKEKIAVKRKERFMNESLRTIFAEAKKLGINKQELIGMLEKIEEV